MFPGHHVSFGHCVSLYKLQVLPVFEPVIYTVTDISLYHKSSFFLFAPALS
nr:MAG TPA: hypothetical protein [Caudoviricetes sp.]